jgi:hypothetical protein
MIVVVKLCLLVDKSKSFSSKLSVFLVALACYILCGISRSFGKISVAWPDVVRPGLPTHRLVPHLDVVVGGHTHSFLFTRREDQLPGTSPMETVRGPYPTIVKNVGTFLYKGCTVGRGFL